MLITLVGNTVFEIIKLFHLARQSTALGFLIGLLISLIGTFFLIGCLTRIGDAEGERLVLGRNVVR